MEDHIQATQARVYRRDIAQKGSVRIRMSGNSMYPFLKNNDFVLVQKLNFENIKIGDIVLTCDNDRILCHRVFAIKNNRFQTKADAFTKPDNFVSDQMLIGKVTQIKSKEKIIDLNTGFSYVSGFLISKLMIVGAYFYIPLRFLRKLFFAP
jgi:signal peptidase I